MTLGHTGNGTDPVANPANSTGCSAGQYVAGEHIALSGAVPDAGWQIFGWTGTSNDSSTGNTNTLTMPAGTRTATVIYTEIPITCYALTLGHTGKGTDPVATPSNSTGCSAGQYVAGENIALSGAVPDAGWQIFGWTGTSNDASKAATNQVTMPADDRTATVVYVPTAVTTPVPLSPSGTISGIAKPDFVWSTFPGATSYKLAVWSEPAEAYVVLSVIPTTACDASQCSYSSPMNLANGNYRFKVMAYIVGGATPYSDWLLFSITGVATPLPSVPPTLIAPNGTVDTHRPIFQWNAVENATFYRLAVYSYATYTYVVVENVYPTCAAGVCSYTPSTWDLVNGSYGFKMRSRNSSGYTDYGTMMKFSVSSNLPVAPTLIAPSGTVVTNPPAFQWNEVSGATRYRLLVYSVASGSYVIDTNVDPAACSSGVCTYTPVSALASGLYKYKMSTTNPYGISGYSAFKSFTVP